MKFHKLGLDDRIVSVLVDQPDFKQATEIQRQAIPLMVKKKQVIGISPSGTGKTIAFLAPLIHNIIREKVEHNEPIGLILTPTRELARQIYEQVVLLGEKCAIQSSLVISQRKDTKIKRDSSQNPVDIIVGTPLKVKESVKSGLISLSKIKHFVIDESDRMLELGFYDDLMAIIENFMKNKDLRIHMFSATFNLDLEKLAKQIITKPLLVEVARNKISNSLTVKNYEILPENRQDQLVEILRGEPINNVIVFTRTQSAARILSKYLLGKGFDLEEIHGGLTNKQRIRALENFFDGDVEILVASDLIARGIDIPDLSHVINYDIPRELDDYIHRIGRTARAGKPGTAINLVQPKDIYLIEKYHNEINRPFKISKRLPDELRKPVEKTTSEGQKQRKLKKAPLQNKKRKFGDRWNYKHMPEGGKSKGKSRRR